MCSKFPISKTRVLQALVICTLSFKAHCFENKTFAIINKFFQDIRSDLYLDRSDIDQFNEHKIISTFVTKKYKINIPYFIFESTKKTGITYSILVVFIVMSLLPCIFL